MQSTPVECTCPIVSIFVLTLKQHRCKSVTIKAYFVLTNKFTFK